MGPKLWCALNECLIPYLRSIVVALLLRSAVSYLRWNASNNPLRGELQWEHCNMDKIRPEKKTNYYRGETSAIWHGKVCMLVRINNHKSCHVKRFIMAYWMIIKPFLSASLLNRVGRYRVASLNVCTNSLPWSIAHNPTTFYDHCMCQNKRLSMPGWKMIKNVTLSLKPCLLCKTNKVTIPIYEVTGGRPIVLDWMSLLSILP